MKFTILIKIISRSMQLILMQRPRIMLVPIKCLFVQRHVMLMLSISNASKSSILLDLTIQLKFFMRGKLFSSKLFISIKERTDKYK